MIQFDTDKLSRGQVRVKNGAKIDWERCNEIRRAQGRAHETRPRFRGNPRCRLAYTWKRLGP